MNTRSRLSLFVMPLVAAALALLAAPRPAEAQYYRGPSSRSYSRSRSSGSQAVNPASPVGQVYAVPEEDSNTVLIIGPPRHFEAVRKILEQLDVPPAQVLIQAMFVEVALTDAFDWEPSGTIFGSPQVIKALDEQTGRTFPTPIKAFPRFFRHQFSPANLLLTNSMHPDTVSAHQ